MSRSEGAVASRSSKALAMAAGSAIDNSLPLSLNLDRFTLGIPNYTFGRLVWQRSNFEKPKYSDLLFVYVLAGRVHALPTIETGGAVGWHYNRDVMAVVVNRTIMG